MDDLNSYLAEFSLAGSLPTSALASLGASQYQGSTPQIKLVDKDGRAYWAAATKIPVSELKGDLNVIGVKAGSGAVYDAALVSAFKTWASRSGVDPYALDKDPQSATGSVALLEQTAYGKLKGNARAARASNAVLAAKAKGKKPTAATTASAKPGLVSVKAAEMQSIVKKLGATAKGLNDGKFGPTTAKAWGISAKKRNLDATSQGKAGASTAKVNAATLATLRQVAGVTPAAPTPVQKPVPAKTAAAPKKPVSTATKTPAAPTVAKGFMFATTDDVQGILKRLGHPKDRLSDGKFGGTTKGAWEQSATKRKLDATIRLKTPSDLTQVLVNERTYLLLKADADAKVPPQPGSRPAEPVGGSLVSLPPAQVQKVSFKDVQKVVDLLGGEKGKDLGLVYQNIAKSQGLDPRIEKADASNAIVLKETWSKLSALAAEAAPKPVAQKKPGPEKDQHDALVTKIVAESKGSIAVSKVRTAINAAVALGLLSSKVAASGTWEASLTSPLMKMLKLDTAAAPVKEAWTTALVKGKLVSKDGKTVKLPAGAVSTLSSAAQQYTDAQKKAEDTLKGFTQVNAADVIAKINALSVTSARFDRAGGAKELADAVKTFLDVTKTATPSGSLVRTVKEKTFVNTKVLTALAAAAVAAQKRADATKKFRDAMVNTALQASTGKVSVRDLQEAIRGTLLSGSAGPAKALYEKVSITGAFDKPTRDAFTEIARTPTIGPSVLEFEALLKQQLGPNFDTKLVVEARNQVWEQFLQRAVAKQNGSLMISMLPTLAKTVAVNADLYERNTAADKRHAEQASAQQAELKKAIQKSTATLSLVHVQQGLLELVENGSLKTVSGLKISGVADAGTREGLFRFAGLIFPEGYVIPETLWAGYLQATGFKVQSDGTFTRTWKGANYISLPPSVATKLAEAAGRWIAKKGKSSIQVVDFKNPTVIRVTVPKTPAKEVVFDPEAEKRAADAEAKAKAAEERVKAAEAAAQAAKDAQDASERAAMQAEVQRAKEEAQRAKEEMERRVAEAEAKAQESAAESLPESEPQPTFLPPSTESEEETQTASQDVQVNVNIPQAAQPVSPEPVQAGMAGGNKGLLLMGAIGLGMFMLSQKDKKKEPGDENSRA